MFKPRESVNDTECSRYRGLAGFGGILKDGASDPGGLNLPGVCKGISLGPRRYRSWQAFFSLQILDSV